MCVATSAKSISTSISTSADNVALLSFAAAFRAAVWLLQSAGQQSIDISCSPGPQQQIHSIRVWQANGTDIWMDTVPLQDHADTLHTLRAVPMKRFSVP